MTTWTSSVPKTRPTRTPPGCTPIERVGDVIAAIYDTAADPAGWPACLEAIRRELSGNFAALVVRLGSADDIGFVVSAGGERPPIGPSTPGVPLSPFANMPPERLVTVEDVLSEAEWRACAYYRDWCAPHDIFHVMAANILTQDQSTYGFRVTRPEGAPAFSEEDLALGRHLVRHIRRALDLHLTVHKGREVHSLYSHAMAQLMIGVIILDHKGKVLDCNPAARAILEARDGLRVVGGELEAAFPTDNRKLVGVIRDALQPRRPSAVRLVEALSVRRPSGNLGWGLVVQSISPDQWTEGKHRPSVAVFVRDSEARTQPPTRLAQQLFELTPAEAALAIQLANGLSLDEAGEALGIRRNTARAHLRSIFSKTGVRRQTELVRIFLNSVAWLAADRP